MAESVPLLQLPKGGELHRLQIGKLSCLVTLLATTFDWGEQRLILTFSLREERQEANT